MMDQFDQQKQVTISYILSQTNIRMAVYNSSGMGHQACTANIINTLARWGYSNTITLYADTDIFNYNSPLVKKLMLLFVQFSPNNSTFQVGNLTVVVRTLPPRPLEESELGILGGYDKDQDFEYLLNVKNLVVLQPFRWTRGECYIKRKGLPVIYLDNVLTASYLNRGFYMPKPVLNTVDKQILMNSFYKNQLEVIEVVQGSLFNIGVTYGITTLMANNPEVGLFNYVAGILQAQDNGIGGGAVVFSLGTLGDIYSEENNWDCFQQWVYSGKPQKFCNKPSATFTSWHTRAQVSLRVKVLPRQSSITKTEIEKALANLKSKEVLVINLGSLPQLLFNYLYGCATLPTVFEGQSTTDLMLNLGCPYFKLSGTDDYKVMSAYPTLPVTSLTPGSRSKLFTQLTYNAIQITPDCWAVNNEKKNSIGGVNYVTFPPAAGFIMIKAMKKPGQGPALDAYFMGLKLFFNDEKNDKLLLALNYFVNTAKPVIDETAQKEKALIAGGPLEELFNRLQAAVTNKVLDYYKAIDSGTLFSFFKAIASALNITVVKLEMNADKTSIELVGNTADLGVGNAQLRFVFTYENDNYQAEFTASLTEAIIPFSGAQWLTFGDWNLAASIKENDTMPVTGAFTCTMAAGKKLKLSVSYPNGKGNIIIGGQFTDGAFTLNDIFQLAGGMNLTAQLPAQLSGAADIGLAGLEFAYNFTTNTADYFSLDVAYDKEKPWTIIPGLMEAKKLGCNIIVYEPGNLETRQLAYTLNGQFGIGDGVVEITANLPGLSIYGGLGYDSPPISIDQLIGHFLNLSSPIKANISEFAFNYQHEPVNYSVSCKVDTDWPIGISDTPIFTIKQLGFSILGKAKESVTGRFTGAIVILPESQNIELLTTAAYNGPDAGWIFSAKQTAGELGLIELFTGYLPQDWKPDNNDFDIKIDGLGITIETISSSWEFTAKTAQPIKVPYTGLEISGNLKLGYKGDKNNTVAVAAPGYYGNVSALVEWNDINLTLFYNFDPAIKKYGVTCVVAGLTVEGYIITENNQSIATLTFAGSPTVGGLIETFITWATGSQFGLAAPWSILNDIPLPNVSLVYDFTKEKVSFDVKFRDIELGFATIKGINVSYNSNDPDPDNNGVIVTLNITSPFGDVKPWNAAKPETTPAPPGQGNKYLDLRMLAMGQHVTIQNITKANSVKEAIALMEKMPIPEPGKIPQVTFDPNSSWLIGMDFGVLKLGDDDKNNALVAAPAAEEPGYLLTLQSVFNDPNLYGLRIALAGEAAKVFKGLDFQIMYKKISDSVGVFMAEIVLPDVMRKIKMGEFNITLPVFGIALYTNGDFQVDIGFPWKEDFSRSLTFDALIITPIGVPIPVMGSVGLYFGKLSSATTNRVPQSDKGTFNPVLVFGYGMQFGLGYSFDEGPLKAGFSLTIIAILEGVLAKWNPYLLQQGPNNNTQLETSYYFWIRGTVGIIGRLYGSIDFSIIKASLTIDLRVIAQMTFTPYEPILLSITASVDVALTVTISLGIFKIHINFSFSARISQSITLPAIGGKAPWAPDTAYAITSRLHKRLPHYFKQATLPGNVPVWSNLIKADAVTPLKGYVGLGLTVAGDEAATTAQQLACYVSMLFIESVQGPQDDKLTCVQSAFENKSLADTDSSFEKLCKMIFRWAVAAIQPNPVTSSAVDELVITDEQLKQLMEYLSNRENPVPITAADINAFMSDQFLLTIIAAQQEGAANGTYFPVPDTLHFSVPAYGNTQALSYSYGDYNVLSANYISEIAQYFDELAISLQQKGSGRYATAGNATTSMGSFVFGDYFLLLCRQMLQAASNSLKDFKYFLQTGDTPQSIVNRVHQNGQPLYEAHELFTDNAAVELTAGKQLAITESACLVQTGDTFDSISKNNVYTGAFTGAALALFNSNTRNILNAGIAIQYPSTPVYTTLPGQSLADIATALTVTVEALINNTTLLTLSNLLQPVATIAIPAFNYTTQTGDTLRSIATRFGITPAILAAPDANSLVADLFNKTAAPAIDIVYLGQFKVAQLLAEIQATQGLQHLSGMASRYYMAGLRLPTNGITPQHPGMWVQQNGNTFSLPAYAGLYALTGQQFPLPSAIQQNNYDITYSTSSPWLVFDGANPSQVVISIVPGQMSAKQIQAVSEYAINNKLDVGTSFLGAAGTFNSQPTTYPLTSEINWNYAASIPMPYGNVSTGVPAYKWWQLPDTLLSLPDPSRAVDPRVQLLLGQHNSATGSMTSSPVNYYGYATQVVFAIKKIPVVSNSGATTCTYEVTGADGANADLLEKIVSGIGNDDTKIAGLFLSYAVDPNGSTSQGLQADDLKYVTMGIAKVNLSTDTRPDLAVAANSAGLTDTAVQQFRLLNTPTGFINLLWEAGITRAGGFYLYYYNAQDAGGLPERIFNDRGEATLHLMVLYKTPTNSSLQNNITNYMNTLVTAEAIDTSNSVLYAQADPITHELPTATNQTLQQLAYDYYGNVADIAADNKDLTLTNDIIIKISEGVYEVAPAGPDNLEAIATWFNTTAVAIKAANPLRQQWPDPLPLFTAVLLPEINVTIGKGKGGNTLASLAAYYGQHLTSLANFNQQVTGLFATNQFITIQGGPVTRTATVPAGVAAMEAVRPVPHAVPNDPADPDYAKYFLQNTYSLLTYQVVENEYFNASNISLPVSATVAPVDTNNFDKIRAPKMAVAGEEWNFKLSIPYSRFSKSQIQLLAALPNPNESPYRGVGDVLSVHFAWQDYYGNQLITTLDQPQPGAILNQPPVLTGYTDALMGLNQWPCVNTSWLVTTDGSQKPQLQLPLNFDNSPYQGLNNIKAVDSTTVLAKFTLPLDQASATTISNYSLQQQERKIVIRSITLNADQQSVTITVDKLVLSDDQPITMNFGNISESGKSVDAGASLSFSGVATFYYTETPALPSTPVTDNALRDLQAYRQLWYQLTDPNGIGLSIATTLLQQPVALTQAQVNDLVQNWIASIYGFLANRAEAKTTVPAPGLHTLSFPIDRSALNNDQLFALNLQFLVERTGGSVAGDFETTSGVKQVASTVAIYAAKNGDTYSFDAFAQQFEQALQLPGEYALYVATGIDRTDSLNNSGEVWAVRKGLNQQNGISYQVNHTTAPAVFAPRPMSNVLENYAEVPIRDFDPKTGIAPKPSRWLDFSGIDMDQWARTLFTSIDTVLSPAYTAAVQLVDNHFNSDINNSYYAALINNKALLAGIVQKWMIPVLEGESADATGVQESFRQLLLVQLSNAYNANAAIQFTATVQAATPNGIAPRLYGAVTQILPVTPIAGVQYDPVSITAAKLELAPALAAPVNCIVTSPQIVKDNSGTVIPYIDLDLEYSANTIEQQISQLSPDNPYLASSWLHFLTTGGNNAFVSPLGKCRVPLFLRSFPSTPAMIAQSGKASVEAGVDFNTLLNWDYTITWSQPFHYPQDILTFEVNFNIKDDLSQQADDNYEVFSKIAEFITVLPGIQDAFNKTLATIDAQTTDSQLFTDAGVALKSYNDLVNDIINAGNTSVNGLALSRKKLLRTNNENLTYKFELTEGIREIEQVEAFVVSINPKTPAGIEKAEVRLNNCDTFIYTGNDCTAAYCFYFRDKTTGAIITATEGQQKPDRTIVLKQLNILERQDAETLVQVTRNEKLIPGARSASPFVYTTGQVGYPNNYYPTIGTNTPIDISAINAPSGHNHLPLVDQLRNLFEALLQKNSQPVLSIQMSCQYSYSINTAISDITVPVLMQPLIGVQVMLTDLKADITLEQLINDWANAIELWWYRYQPNNRNGQFNFNLTIFSNLTKQPLPLLKLSELELGVQYITDLNKS